MLYFLINISISNYGKYYTQYLPIITLLISATFCNEKQKNSILSKQLEIVERCRFGTPNTHIHHLLISWLDNET